MYEEHKKMNSVIIEGKEVKVGDWVGFKSDIEQSGRIIKIEVDGWNRQERLLTLVNESGFDGEYIGGDGITTVWASECWVNG
jgi:hypothetical protein